MNLYGDPARLCCRSTFISPETACPDAGCMLRLMRRRHGKRLNKSLGWCHRSVHTHTTPAQPGVHLRIRPLPVSHLVIACIHHLYMAVGLDEVKRKDRGLLSCRDERCSIFFGLAFTLPEVLTGSERFQRAQKLSTINHCILSNELTKIFHANLVNSLSDAAAL